MGPRPGINAGATDVSNAGARGGQTDQHGARERTWDPDRGALGAVPGFAPTSRVGSAGARNHWSPTGLSPQQIWVRSGWSLRAMGESPHRLLCSREAWWQHG